MIKTKLYQRTIYLNKDIPYLFNCEIIEYDMKRAGLSLIQSKLFKLRSFIGEERVLELEKMDKEECNKQIGMLQKNKEVANLLLRAFEEARALFFEANDIDDNDILAIKKDAIFIINKRCEHCIFDTINFRIKNIYSGYMYINHTEFYYTDINTDLDVKGIDDKSLEYHKEYMLDFIRDIFSYATTSSFDLVTRTLIEFINAYRSFNLDKEYYRELNSESYFDLYDENHEIIKIQGIEEEDIENLDIRYNYFNYLIPLVSLFI